MRVAEREQTVAEEIMNALSHGLGLLLAIASLPILVWSAARQSAAAVVGASLFAGTMILLYWRVDAVPRAAARPCQGLVQPARPRGHLPVHRRQLHALPVRRAARALGLDAVRRHLVRRRRWASPPSCSTGCGIRCGRPASTWRWAGWRWWPRCRCTSACRARDWRWLVAGGLAYTAGAVVFLFDSKLRFAHFVWHLFVLAGSACHFFAVLWHAHG